MAFTDYEYDRYAIDSDNLILNEVQQVDMTRDRSVFPKHGAFYDDQNGLVIEGRTGTGAWEKLDPEVDFQYSPLFLQAAAKTGKQVFSYIILIKSVSEVRMDYQALGQYEDTALMAILATSNIDRSKIHEWDTIWAPSEYYNPRLREPSLHDKTSVEVFNEAINKLLIAISNPMSSSVITTSDITKLQQQVSNTVSREDLENYPMSLSSEAIELAPNSPDVVLSLPSDITAASFIVTFTATNGRSQAIHAMIVRRDDIIDQTIYGEVMSDDDMITFRASVTAGQTLVTLTADVAGIAKTKLLFAS